MRATLIVELPEDLETALRIAGYTSEQLSIEARRSLAVALFNKKILSLEQSARLAGMNLWDFIPFLGAQGISVADYDEEEAEREVETARWIAENPKK